mgnify:CR=1 FL=1
MGKLRDLREELDGLNWDDPRREEIQKKINGIEQWCIDNGNKGNITKLTIFSRAGDGGNVKYPWHSGFVNIRDIGMIGIFNGTGINYNSDKSVHHCSDCIKT